MVEITKKGVEQTLLVVKAVKNHQEEFTCLDWEYPDKPNAYFLIGVLESIKLELLNHIAKESDNKLNGRD